jgi:sulfatase maturation enzyme AslB (radical SAM superfamily)
MHIFVGPDSIVLPFCVADRQYPMGNVNEKSIDSIVKSDRFNTLRKNMLNNQRSKECNYCYIKEDSGLTSLRQSHNARWKISVETATIDNVKPVYLDIRLSNVCNLKCRMCSSYFSSAISAEEAKIFNVENATSTLNLKNQDATLKEILSYLPNVEKIYFAGGEPLLSKEHYIILQSLIDCNNIDLEIIYSTNFTKLKYQNYSVFDLWPKFSNITISASLDAHGTVAEYVRHGTKWAEIEQNLILLKKYCPNVKFTVISTVGFLNVASLIALQQQWHCRELLDIQNFSLIAMISPEHLTVSALPLHHKQRLESLIVQHINWCKNNNATILAQQWNDVLKYMWLHDHSHHLDEFKRLTNIMDSHRGQSLIEVLPEYHDLL